MTHSEFLQLSNLLQKHKDDIVFSFKCGTDPTLPPFNEEQKIQPTKVTCSRLLYLSEDKNYDIKVKFKITL